MQLEVAWYKTLVTQKSMQLLYDVCDDGFEKYYITHFVRTFSSRMLNAINVIFQHLKPKKPTSSKLVYAIKFAILLQCTLIFESALQQDCIIFYCFLIHSLLRLLNSPSRSLVLPHNLGIISLPFSSCCFRSETHLLSVKLQGFMVSDCGHDLVGFVTLPLIFWFSLITQASSPFPFHHAASVLNLICFSLGFKGLWLTIVVMIWWVLWV